MVQFLDPTPDKSIFIIVFLTTCIMSVMIRPAYAIPSIPTSGKPHETIINGHTNAATPAIPTIRKPHETIINGHSNATTIRGLTNQNILDVHHKNNNATIPTVHHIDGTSGLAREIHVTSDIPRQINITSDSARDIGSKIHNASADAYYINGKSHDASKISGTSDIGNNMNDTSDRSLERRMLDFIMKSKIRGNQNKYLNPRNRNDGNVGQSYGQGYNRYGNPNYDQVLPYEQFPFTSYLPRMNSFGAIPSLNQNAIPNIRNGISEGVQYHMAPYSGHLQNFGRQLPNGYPYSQYFPQNIPQQQSGLENVDLFKRKSSMRSAVNLAETVGRYATKDTRSDRVAHDNTKNITRDHLGHYSVKNVSTDHFNHSIVGNTTKHFIGRHAPNDFKGQFGPNEPSLCLNDNSISQFGECLMATFPSIPDITPTNLNVFRTYLYKRDSRTLYNYIHYHLLSITSSEVFYGILDCYLKAIPM